MIGVRSLARWPEAMVTRLIWSRPNYWATFAIDAFATIWFLWRGVRSGGASWHGALVAGAVGYGIWTLFEYAVHRHVFHGRIAGASQAHIAHHRAPRDLVGLPFFVPVSIAIGWWLFAGGLLPDAHACFLVAGSYSGYVCYSAVHHATHATALRAWPLERRQQIHMTHHAWMKTNFGVTTSLWDHVFGTHASGRAGGLSRRRSRDAWRRSSRRRASK